MKDWLIKRLTPRKKQEERWTGLADGLQQVWEESFDPAIARLESLRSYFLASDADLALKLREMGDYFAADMPCLQDRPIAVAWRRLELEYKDLELILYSVFRRHYSDLPVTWFPLFAPVGESYGMQFVAAEGPWPEKKNIPPDGMFLTSRGLLGTDYGHLLSIGLSKQEFLDKALPLLKRTKPLHIVYDGPLWYIRFDIPFEADLGAAWERDCGIFEVPFAVVGSRFDFTPADAHALDIETVSCQWEREHPLFFPFLQTNSLSWHTDWHTSEGFPAGWLPLDFVLAGIEGEHVAPFHLYLADSQCAHPMSMTEANLSFTRKTETNHAKFEAMPNLETQSDTCLLMPADFRSPNRLDRFPRFDACPADLFPLDMPIGGVYA